MRQVEMARTQRTIAEGEEQMKSGSRMTHEQMASARITLPEHVVYREFPAETVVLNLQTEQYYGLNPTAGAMLVSLVRSGTVKVTVTEMVERFQRPAEEIERDLYLLCDQLQGRGLIELTTEPQD